MYVEADVENGKVEISEMIGDDLYILPSSIHECATRFAA